MEPAALLQSLVASPSVSGAEGPLADHLTALLAGEGFQVHRQGHNLWFEVGARGPRLLLVSHLDTVPPCADWSQDPQQPWWVGDRLFGLGATDAKGCVAALILAALDASGNTGSIGSATASDWAFLAHLPAVKAGPGDTHRSHRPDEWLSLSELQAGAAFYEKLVRQYGNIVTQEVHHG